MRWAVLATAILVTACLMAPLAQKGAVKANPYPLSPGKIYVYSPEPEEVFWEQNVEIYFKIALDEDLAQIDSFFYSLDNKANSPLTFSRHSDDFFINDEKHTVNTITVRKTLENLTDGTHRIAVFAHYPDGTIESIFYRSITVDTTLPNPYTPFTPVIVSPVKQKTYNTTEVPLTYTIDEEILWSYYYVDNHEDLKYFEGNITLSSLSEGQHMVSLYVVTKTGPHQQEYSTTQKINFYVDTKAPNVSNLSVNNTDADDRLLSYTIDEEASWVGYSLDNQANVTVTDAAVLGDLPFGSHNVTVYVEDSVGNMGASETLYFTITEPLPVPLVIASTGAISAVGVGLLVYFKKRKH